MTGTRLTVHWIVSDSDLGKVSDSELGKVSDSDLGKVSVYTPSKGCVGLYVVRIIYMC